MRIVYPIFDVRYVPTQRIKRQRQAAQEAVPLRLRRPKPDECEG